MISSLLDLHIQFILSQTSSKLFTKKQTKSTLLSCSIATNKNSQTHRYVYRSFTKSDIQNNQLKHKQFPPQTNFAILQNNTLKPVTYLSEHEEFLPHQKHDSHPILADYGRDQFSIHIKDKKDVIFAPLNSFSYKSINLFQTKIETLIKNHNKSFHQQSFLLNDTDITSDDDEQVFTRFPKEISNILSDTILTDETFSTITKPTTVTLLPSATLLRI